MTVVQTKPSLPFYLLILFACGMSFLAFRTPVFNVFFDIGRWLYEAELVMRGSVPYRDFIYQYPPLMVYSLAAWMKIFGVNVEAATGYMVFFSLIILFSQYAIMREFNITAWTSLFVCVLTVFGSWLVAENILFSLNHYAPSILVGYAFALLFFLQVLFYLKQPKSFYPLIRAALFFSLSFFSKQEFMLALLLTALWFSAYLFTERKNAWRHVLIFWLTIFICVSIGMAYWIFLEGMGRQMIQMFLVYGKAKSDLLGYLSMIDLTLKWVAKRMFILLKETFYIAFLIAPFFWRVISKRFKTVISIGSPFMYVLFLKRLFMSNIYFSPIQFTWNFLQSSFFFLPLGALISGWLWKKRKKMPDTEKISAFSLFLFLFLLTVIFARQFIMGIPRYQGIPFYIAIFGTLLSLSFWVQRVCSPWPRHIFQGILLFCISTQMFLIIFMHEYVRYDTPPFVKMKTQRGSFYVSEHQQRSINAILNYVGEHVSSEQSLLSLPYGTWLSFFSQRKYPFSATQLLNVLVNIEDKKIITQEALSHLPDFIIFMNAKRKDVERFYHYLNVDSPFVQRIREECYQSQGIVAKAESLSFTVYALDEQKRKDCESPEFEKLVLQEFD